MTPFRSRLHSVVLYSFYLHFLVGAALLFSASSFAQTAPTNVLVTNLVQTASVKRLGVNLADQAFYDSSQMLKNLVFQNPGFEAEKYRSIMVCAYVTANGCTDDNQWSPQPTGFWKGATYSVLTGLHAGATGSIVASTAATDACTGCGQVMQFDKDLDLAVGDYFVVTNSFPGNGDAGWWDATSGGGTISTETNDLSSESPGKQAALMTASASGAYASLTQYFDDDDGRSFIQLDGTFAVTFRAKGVGGDNQLTVNVERLMPSGTAVYLNQTVTLTGAWADYTLTFSASENGTASGTAQLAFSASGANVELDDVTMTQTNSSASNTTPWRDDVVNALKELNPGTIRMMASYAALGSDIPNQLQVPFARYREGYSTASSSVNTIAYGIHEFLQLCQAVGADPWITIPTATTQTEMTDFIEYLTGTGSDPWSALRISRGQMAPWTTVFNKIHIEFGNETWNGSFRGESMTSAAYPQLANRIFGAARKTTGYVASNFDLVLDGFAADPGYNVGLLSVSNQHDSFDIAPYLLFNANNEAQSTMFGALFAEPELFDSPGGEVYGSVSAAATAPTPTYLNVYETNLSPLGGTVTQAQLNNLTPSLGAGIAHVDHMLQMMRLGVKYQNAFALPQYNDVRSDGKTITLWGMVVDMGTTNRRRPQFLAQALANSAIGGNMLQVAQTGANPTWNQPLSSDNVQLNGAHYLQSFAFKSGDTISVVLFNLNLTSALPVTFSGTNTLAGTVQMSQITSANITDNNENADTVQTLTKTLSGFNPATGLSLPPFSMTLLTMVQTPSQAPAFSVAAGTYAGAQTVTMTEATPGTSIYYSTDGSLPGGASTLYTGPVTVSATETLQAIAIGPGIAPSAVTTAAYVIQSLATTAAPAFSVPAGTYAQVLQIKLTDATAGATIYYTTDGTTPTTASPKYKGYIQVEEGLTVTIKTIAVAAKSAASAAAKATYTTLPPAPPPTASVASGTYTAPQSVVLKAPTANSFVLYTLNGPNASTGWTRYTAPITIANTATVTAITCGGGFSPSYKLNTAITISTPLVAAK